SMPHQWKQMTGGGGAGGFACEPHFSGAWPLENSMKRFLPAAAGLSRAACAYIGDPQPPLANIPPGVNDLAAMQRGGQIIVQFTVPALTTEGHPIPRPLKLDLRAGPADHFEPNQWAVGARQIPPGA